MVSIDLPIVVVAFNKVKPLSRLLSSLHQAHYPVQVKLIISIDGGASAEVQRIADEFEWLHGEKEVIVHPENMGLRRHVLYCGGLSQQYQGVLLLEDDLFVSPWFYQYAMEVVPAYEVEDNVCGMALYSPGYNETSYMPFHPLSDGSDCYFMQLPCSWGQIWLRRQWQKFEIWYEIHQDVDLSSDRDLPHNIRVWPETSWKKYFVKYMLEKEKYFIYPYDSFTTNCGEAGQHHTGTHLFQVPLTLKKDKFEFVDFVKSHVKYDAFCELQADCLKKWCKWLADYEFDVDLHGAKENFQLTSQYVLTSKKCDNYLRSQGRSLVPIENNVINSIEGQELFFAEKISVQQVYNINKYVYLKSNEYVEHCYYYSLDGRHFSVNNKKMEYLKNDIKNIREKIQSLRNKYGRLKAQYSQMKDELKVARQEIFMLRNSYAFKIGSKLIAPLSYVRRLVSR